MAEQPSSLGGDNNWPERRYVCIKCRHTACNFDDHDLPGHDLTSLKTVSGRERLITQVWGRQLRNASSDGMTPTERGAACFLVAIVGMALAMLDVPIAGVLGVAALCVGLVFLTLGENDQTGTRKLQRERATALAASAAPARLASGGALTGIVEGQDLATSPLGGEPCVAFAVTLHAPDKLLGDIMLRDGATTGFTIVTQDGNHIQIPPGPIELIYHRASESQPHAQVGKYLDEFDRLRLGMTRDADPFAHARATEIVILPDDHVALYSPIVRTGLLPNATFGGYRSAPASSYEVQGTPSVELLDPHE